MSLSSASSNGGLQSQGVLDVSNLSVDFPTESDRVDVVKDVSFYVERGETLGLVGESGSGKSVTAMSIMGLVSAHGGRISGGSSIRLEGQELVGMGRQQLSSLRGMKMAMIFQEPMTSLNPAFTVGKQIGGVIRRHLGVSRREARRKTVELLDRVGIPNAEQRVDQYPHNFSGGMRQRVLIAMALSCQPSLLIADEPTTALDVTIQARVLDLLKDLQEEFHMGVIFVTHDLGVVADMCDRVAVMYAGSIVEESEAENLFDRPLHPYTEGLLQSMPLSVPEGEELRSIKGTVPVPGSWPAGCRFAPRCPHAIDACTEPEAQEMRVMDDGRMSRCLRVGELELDGSGEHV